MIKSITRQIQALDSSYQPKGSRYALRKRNRNRNRTHATCSSQFLQGGDFAVFSQQ